MKITQKTIEELIKNMGIREEFMLEEPISSTELTEEEISIIGIAINMLAKDICNNIDIFDINELDGAIELLDSIAVINEKLLKLIGD